MNRWWGWFSYEHRKGMDVDKGKMGHQLESDIQDEADVLHDRAGQVLEDGDEVEELVVMRVGRFRSLCPFFQSEVTPLQNTVRNAARGRLPALLLDCLEPLCSGDDISDAVGVDYELPYWDTPEQAEASVASTVWGYVQQFALVFVQRTMSVAAWTVSRAILWGRVAGVGVDGALLPVPIVTTSFPSS